ncbi:MAG TPA: nucleotidyl transferase AbiEii/AbiGii toxin family protein [Anaerolineae bacterium]|nr:nucleotidyl transferase AbiEii/AbiGii toxin family protein [Anaerolineae bacterium]
MATLIAPHWEAVPATIRQLWPMLARHRFIRQFYLAGGTALALQLGHRISVDLDFFPIDREVDDPIRSEIVAALSNAAEVAVLEDVFGNLLMMVDDVRTGFFGYGYPLVSPPWQLDGIQLASLADIGLMKLDAVSDRANRKDFYDLYLVAQSIPLDELVQLSKVKYPLVRDFEFMVYRGLTFFDVADKQAGPDLLIELTWDVVKSFFIDQSKRLAREWFEE